MFVRIETEDTTGDTRAFVTIADYDKKAGEDTAAELSGHVTSSYSEHGV